MIRGGSPQIWVREVDGRSRQVTLDSEDHYLPAWVDGDREIAYVSFHDGGSYRVVDATTGIERQLFRLNDLPLPPGTSLGPVPMTRVAMTLLQGGVPNLWLATLKDGRPDGHVERLTSEPEGGSFPHWSPDGKWLAYQCASGPNEHICVVDAQGGTPRQLTHGPEQNFIGGWMGNDIVLAAARRAGVWNIVGVSRVSGQSRQLTSFTDARSFVRYPQWDQAGKRLIFERAEYTANVWKVSLR
jgi:Tol biopolymer transport system component